MITHEMIEAQRKLYSQPIVIGDVAIKVLTVRNRHFGILDGVTIPGKTMVEVDPGYVFGDGTHPTTRMCVEEVQKHTEPGDYVLDVGCGCGILSIVSILRGAEHAKAVDIDPLCVEVAKNNAERNGVSGRFTASIGDLTYGVRCRYDLIVANILADPLLRLLEDVPRVCKEDTTLILSGIRDSRAAEVEQAARKHFHMLEKKTEDNWVCLVLTYKEEE